MARRKRKAATKSVSSFKLEGLTVAAGESSPPSAPVLIIASRLSKRLGVSDVTLWRWRHDERSGFPKGRLINRRVYFPWHEVTAWLERQQEIA
jgi:predicted DNA-binding transcriptional regulator AlpA